MALNEQWVYPHDVEENTTIPTGMPSIIFDTETTGLIDPRIIEAGWIETDISPDGQLLYGMPFVQRYNPEIPSTLGALKVHNILDSELVNMPLHTTFSVPETVKYIICQNSSFDMKMVPNPEKYKAICIVGMSTKLWPEADSHSLGAMMYHVFGRTEQVRTILKDAHSALTDCMMTWSLLQQIIEKANIKSIEDLFKFSEMAKLTTERMPFGKYKGMYLVDIVGIEKSYLAWLRDNREMDDNLRTIAGKILKGCS